MTAYHWKGVTGDWNSNERLDAGQRPTQVDGFRATIGETGTYAVAVDLGDRAKSLTLSDAKRHGQRHELIEDWRGFLLQRRCLQHRPSHPSSRAVRSPLNGGTLNVDDGTFDLGRDADRKLGVHHSGQRRNDFRRNARRDRRGVQLGRAGR